MSKTQLTIVGEKINTSRNEVREAVEKRDAAFIRTLARRQAESGAHYIDVNCGTFIGEEPDLLTWIVEQVQDELALPLCIDSPNPAAIEAALKHHRHGRPIVSSISGERQRYDAVVPLVKEFGCKIVVLCLDEKGIPHDANTRYAIAARVIGDLQQAGVKPDDIYVDPLIQPVSIDTANALIALETIRRVKEAYPETHSICGLSNVSFGLPERKLINRVFIAMCMMAGLDTAILDPTDKKVLSTIVAAEVLLNQDPFCSAYLKAYRQHLLE